MVERVHRHLKEGLKARGAQADWPQHLPWVLLNIRTTPTTDSNVSAAEVLYGTTLTLPAQLAAPDETAPAAVDSQRTTTAIPTRRLPQSPPTHVPPHLSAAELVYVRQGGQQGMLVPPYSGPYRVLDRSPKYFTVEVGGQPQTITVDRLKPHTCPTATTPAAPPHQGRPPTPQPNTPPTGPSPPSRSPSPGLPATTTARPARTRRAPSRLDL
jgi:hypothetical protein